MPTARFTITGEFKNKNQPDIIEEEPHSLETARAKADSIFRRFAALKSVSIDDHAGRLKHIYSPGPEQLHYQFSIHTINLNLP